MFSPPRLLPLLGLTLILSGLEVLWALDLSNPEEAEPELEALVAEWEEARKVDDSAEAALNHAFALQALGIIERQAAKPNEALEHLTLACDLLEKHAPDQRIDALEAKALTLQDLGELEESETLLREVLEPREQAKEAALDLAATLDHLAMNLLIQGRYPEVAPLLDRAIDLLGDDHPTELARLLDHRGRLLHTLGSHARAIAAFREALALPFESPELRLTLESQIALAQLRLGKDEEARAGIEAVADQAADLFRERPLKAVPYINNLGELALRQGDLEEARSAFEESVEILEKVLGPDHPSLIGPLNNLGVSEQMIGKHERARSILEQAAALQSKHLPPTHLRVAETQGNLARNALLSGSADAAEQVRRATQLGLNLLDELIRSGSERERLNFLERFDLLSLPCAIGDAELIADVLLASKARLLDAMLSEAEKEAHPSWREIQASLEPGTAFVDTCRCFTVANPSTEQYGAILLLPEGAPKWVPLGSAEELRGWLDALRNRLVWRSASLSGDAGKPPALKLAGILRALDRGFWQPFGDQLPEGTEHIAFSPSGMLHFLPLAALLDADDRPLAARYLQITTLSSGRDLLASRPGHDLNSEPWAVLTVSDFPKTPSTDDPDRLLKLLSELEAMPGTREEAKRLKRIAPRDSIFLKEAEASEIALRTLLTPPSVLHLGCHAFFLNDPEGDRLPVDFDERSDLLYSGGLVLYRGAERSIDSPRVSDSDDLLYPSEIARLPLQGTRLVTLSSCESGAGTPVSGEGILGLRRSFSLAGAREVVVALWPVSDSSTPTFMDHFYRRASTSNRPAQSLWQTQGDFLSAAENEEDFEFAVLRYAPFVLSQNTPLTTGPAIPPAEISDSRTFNWFYLLAAIPLVAFVVVRVASKRHEPRVISPRD
ncbi:MAG: CHAT domain-containing tetratricopeptide repeat protein [Verrucomicrobiota bacterium]